MNLPLTTRSTFAWQGLDAIGQKARIDGDAESGFDCRYYDESTERWRTPGDVDQYRWIIDAFLADLIEKAK